MSYKVLIVDNDSGKTLYDKDNVVALVGAMSDGVQTTVNALTDCKALDMAYAILGAQKAANELINRHPEVKVPLVFLQLEDE